MLWSWIASGPKYGRLKKGKEAPTWSKMMGLGRQAQKMSVGRDSGRQREVMPNTVSQRRWPGPRVQVGIARAAYISLCQLAPYPSLR